MTTATITRLTNRARRLETAAEKTPNFTRWQAANHAWDDVASANAKLGPDGYVAYDKAWERVEFTSDRMLFNTDTAPESSLNS